MLTANHCSAACQTPDTLVVSRRRRSKGPKLAQRPANPSERRAPETTVPTVSDALDHRSSEAGPTQRSANSLVEMLNSPSGTAAAGAASFVGLLCQGPLSSAGTCPESRVIFRTRCARNPGLRLGESTSSLSGDVDRDCRQFHEVRCRRLQLEGATRAQGAVPYPNAYPNGVEFSPVRCHPSRTVHPADLHRRTASNRSERRSQD